MSDHKPDLDPRAIRQHYPECPQRDIALGLLREGKLAQAEAWLKTLDQLIRRGQAGAAQDLTEGKRSA